MTRNTVTGVVAPSVLSLVERVVSFFLSASVLLYFGFWAQGDSNGNSSLLISVAAILAITLARISCPLWSRCVPVADRVSYARSMAIDGMLTGLIAAAGFAWCFGFAVGISVSMFAVAILFPAYLLSAKPEHLASTASNNVLPDSAYALTDKLAFQRKSIIADHELENPSQITLTPHGYLLRWSPVAMASFSESEIVAVIAHELGHFKQKTLIRDALAETARSVLAIAIIASIVSGVFLEGGLRNGTIAAAGLVFVCYEVISLPPLLWLGRRGELAADRFAAELTGDPDSILGARKKIMPLSHKSTGTILEKLFVDEQPDWQQCQRNLALYYEKA